MARKITASVLDKLKSWEGLRLAAYPDSGGVWTIGYGHTGKDVYKGRKITTAEAEDLLLVDLARFERAVDEAVTVPLTDNQFGALVSFAFNCGVGNFKDSTLLRRVNAGKLDAVPDQLRRWVHVGDTRVNGLVKRRESEIKLWLAPSGTAAAAPTVPADFATARIGSRGETVRQVQAALGVTADGVFGPATERAVVAFQKSKSLTPDGIVGPQTARALGLI